MEKLRIFLNKLKKEDQIQFALDCGTTIGYLRKRLSDRKHKLGENICIEIESKTNGAVKCEDLRPDVNWSVIRGRA